MTAEAQPEPKAEVVRMSVNLAPDVAAALQDVAARRGITITDAIRKAISMLKYLDDADQRRAKVLIEGRRGGMLEVDFWEAP